MKSGFFLFIALIMMLLPLRSMGQLHYDLLYTMWEKENSSFIHAYLSNDSKYYVLFNFIENHYPRSQVYYTDSLKEVMYIPNAIFLGFTSNNDGVFFYDNQIYKYDFSNQTHTSVATNSGLTSSYLNNVIHYCFNPNLNYVVAIRDSCTTDVYNINTMILEKTIHNSNNHGYLNQVAISDDLTLIAFGFQNAIEVRRFDNNNLLKTINTTCNMKLAITPSDFMIVNFISGKGIETFNVANGDSISFINYSTNFIYDYQFYPDYDILLFNGTKILNLRDWTVTNLGFPGYNNLYILDGRINFLSWIPIVNSSGLMVATRLFVRDLSGNITRVIYDSLRISDFNDDLYQLILSTDFPSLNSFVTVDPLTGNTIATKQIRGAQFAGYIRETNQYYTVDTTNSNIFLNLYDFKTDALIDRDTILNYGKFHSISFYKANKYILLDDSVYFDCIKKKIVSKFNDPGIGTYIFIDTTINKIIYKLIINIITNDTIKLMGSMQCSVVNNNKNLIIFPNNPTQNNKLYVLNFKTMDTIKTFNGDDDDEIGIGDYRTLQDRFLQVIYNRIKDGTDHGQTNKIYDVAADSLIASLYPENIYNEIKLLLFSKDFKYAFGTFSLTGDIKSWQDTSSNYIGGFRTNINYTPPVITEVGEKAVGKVYSGIYPNPVSSAASIRFDLLTPSIVSLKLTDILGNQTTLIDNQFMESASHSVDWDASGVPAGVYCYVLEAGRSVKTGKVVVIR